MCILWLSWMLCIIENMNLIVDSFWGDYVILLRHMACTIYFAIMKDFGLYVYTIIVDIAWFLIFCLLFLICLKILFLELILQWQPHFRDHQIIRLNRTRCCVGPNNQFMNRVIAILRDILCWQPLYSQRWPVENMCQNAVIQKGNMLFPDLVFFICLLICKGFVKLLF